MSCPRRGGGYGGGGLSYFIKSPKVLRLLEKKPSVVQGVLKVLGRCYPGLAMIQQEAAGSEDNLFPIGDSMDSDEEAGDGILAVERYITTMVRA